MQKKRLVTVLAAALAAAGTGSCSRGGSSSSEEAPGASVPTVSPETLARQAAEEFRKGHHREGFALLGRIGDQPVNRVLDKDTQALVDRVQGALAKAKQADALSQKGEHEEAAKLMKEAADQYP